MKTSLSGSPRAADIRFVTTTCSLGVILVATSEKGVCTLLMGDDADTLERDLRRRLPLANLVAGDAELTGVAAQVVRFVESPTSALDMPLDLRGTPFQRRVWRALKSIPAGTTVSYADIAKRIGAPAAVRAVAQACGANAIALAIPCHRVVRSDGTLSGYRWGIERKHALLEREGAR